MEGSPWRVVRGVVRRVVRGAGSVGSPRIGGQSFLLSRQLLLSVKCSAAMTDFMAPFGKKKKHNSSPKYRYNY